MVKKLVITVSAIAALAALVVPAAANATPVLTSGTTTVPSNTEITGTANDSNIRLYTESGFGSLECASVMLNLRVTKNNGSEIEFAGQAGSTTSGCSFEGIEPVNTKNVEIIRIFSNMVEGETGTGTLELAYETEISGGAICKFNNKGKPGSFHYKLATDKLNITKTNMTSSGCGESFLTGEVTLETPNGTPVTVS